MSVIVPSKLVRTASKTVIVVGSFIVAMLSALLSYQQISRASGPSGMQDPLAINARLLRDRQLGDKTTGALDKSARLADISLRLQGLNPSALTLKGATIIQEGKVEAGRRLVRTSLIASRREVVSHLIQIEDSAAENDAEGALLSYDLALRVSTGIKNVLFPILANAISDLEIQNALVPYVKAQAPWMAPFSRYVFENSKSPQHLSNVIVKSGGYGAIDKDRSLVKSLIESLINTNNFDQAKLLYLRNWPDNSYMLKSVSLSEKTSLKVGDRFAWQLFEAAGFGAEPRDVGSIVLYAEGGVRGLAASKLLFLDPGTYTISITETQESPDRPVNADWILRCLSEETYQKLAKTGSVIGQAGKVSPEASSFLVTSGCRAQELQLWVAGGAFQGLGELSLSNSRLKTMQSRQ